MSTYHSNYDSWKLDTPPWYDDEDFECDACGDINKIETMMEYGRSCLCESCYLEAKKEGEE